MPKKEQKMNLDLKFAILKKFRTQADFSMAAK